MQEGFELTQVKFLLSMFIDMTHFKVCLAFCDHVDWKFTILSKSIVFLMPKIVFFQIKSSKMAIYEPFIDFLVEICPITGKNVHF